MNLSRVFDMITYPLTAATLCIDEGPVYPGYVDTGVTWNGWACPFFTREVAERIAEAATAGDFTVAYNEERDAFVETTEGFEDEATDYPAQWVLTAEGWLRLYPVGAWAWVWDADWDEVL